MCKFCFSNTSTTTTGTIFPPEWDADLISTINVKLFLTTCSQTSHLTRRVHGGKLRADENVSGGCCDMSMLTLELIRLLCFSTATASFVCIGFTVCVFMSVLYRKCFSFTVWQREVVHHCEFSGVCVLNHAYSADSIIYYLTWCLHDIVCRGIFIGEDISSKVSANIF